MNKIGTICYIIWGIHHLRAAYGVYSHAMLLQAGVARGRLLQSAWNLIVFAIASIIVGLTLNKISSRFPADRR